MHGNLCKVHPFPGIKFVLIELSFLRAADPNSISTNPHLFSQQTSCPFRSCYDVDIVLVADSLSFL